MNDVFVKTVMFPLLLLIGQTLVALGQRKLNQRMDEGETIAIGTNVTETTVAAELAALSE